jgi:hypothetical protein
MKPTHQIYVLGVDPGTTAGAGLIRHTMGKAIVKSEIIGSWQHNSGKEDCWAFVERVIREADNLAMLDWYKGHHDKWPIYLAHEAQYSGSHADATYRTAIDAGAWRMAAYLRGRWTVVDHTKDRGVHPQTWRAALDDRPKGQRRARKGTEWESWAVEQVRAMGVTCLKTHHHKAEGCLIGIWGARQVEARGM